MQDSDSQVIAAVVAGDADRYAVLVDKYQQRAIRLAYSLLGSAEDAKDVSQDAFISAYRALPRFRGGAKFSTWFYRIVVNKCTDVIRRRMRAPGQVPLGDASGSDEAGVLFVDVPDPGRGPDSQLVNRELAGRLSRAIRSLPMKQQTAFVLHHLNGLSLEEASQIMQCSIGTVKSHVFRATDALRSQLQPWIKEDV